MSIEKESKAISNRPLGPMAPPNVWMDPEVQSRRREAFLQEDGWRILFHRLTYTSVIDDSEITAYLFVRDDLSDPETESLQDVVDMRILELEDTPRLISIPRASEVLATGNWKSYYGSASVDSLLTDSTYIQTDLDASVSDSDV